MKKLLAFLLCICMVVGTFTVMTVSAATVNKDIAAISTIESATDGYETNDAANMTDGDLSTYYMAGKVTANGSTYTSSENIVWIKLADHQKVTKVDITFGSKADRTALFGNSGGQNANFYAYLTDFGPEDGGQLADTNGIVAPAGKTAFRVTNGYTNQSTYTSMSKAVNEDTTFTYMAIYGPYSAGLCISDLKIFADAEDVTPPGPTQIVNKNIASKTTAKFYSGANTTSFVEFTHEGAGADLVIDGDKTTVGYCAALNAAKTDHNAVNVIVVDLGAEYEVTKLNLTLATADQITAARTLIGTTNTRPLNRFGLVCLSKDMPEYADFTGTTYNVADAAEGVKLSAGSSFTNGTYTNTNSNKYRYVAVYAAFNDGAAVSDLEIYANVEEPISDELVEVNKNVADKASGAAFYQGGIEFKYTGVEASKMIDGDATTFGFGKRFYNNGNNLAVVDMGEQYDITKLTFDFASTDEINAVLGTDGEINTNNTVVATDYAPNFNRYAVVVLSNTLPTTTMFSDFVYSGEGEVVKVDNSGSFKATTSLASTPTDKYRYVAIFAPYGGNGIAISELGIYANVMEVSKPAEMVNVAKNKMVYSNGTNVANLKLDPRKFREMYDVDGDAKTAFAAGAHKVADDEVAFDFEAVIDLGVEYAISDIKYIPYGAGKTTIWGSNSYQLNDLTQIATSVASIDNVVQEYANIKASYRYIVVNRQGEAADDVLGIRDIQVNSSIAANDVEAVSSIDNRAVRVSLGKPVIHTGTIRFGGNKENMTDGSYVNGSGASDTFVLNAEAGKRNFAVVDLGKAYQISAVDLTQVKGCSGFNNSAFEVVATNDVITDANIMDANWTVISSNKAFADLTSMYTLPLEITDTTAYRYVGIKGATYAGMPFREFNVFTPANDFDPGNYTVVANGKNVNVDYIVSEKTNGTDATVFVASYDANGVLINIASEVMKRNWNGVSEVGYFGDDTSDNVIENAIASNAVSSKAFLFDGIGTITPLELVMPL